MVFQMGITGFLGFKRTQTFLKWGEYDRAAEEMLDSDWAEQTPGRAQRIANAMETDEEDHLV
jgi:lysozyme